MSGYLDEAVSIEDAVVLAVYAAYTDTDGDVIPSILSDELLARVRAEVEKQTAHYRDTVIAASNLLDATHRDALRRSVGLPPAEVLFG